MNDGTVISLKGIEKEYRMGNKVVRALKGVDLEVREGEVLAVVGPSGAGKSTLLHIMGCLLRPTRGVVIINGIEAYRLEDRELSRLRNRLIGFVFQFYHLIPELTVLENVALPLMVSGMGRKEAGGKALSTLELVGLSERADHMPSELSGGEQQRVAIARALVNDCKILIADEPTGNLDMDTGISIWRIMEGLAGDGKAVVLATHNEALASRAKRVARMMDGALISMEER
jgi:putative ABC transport system ATP-binding protein